MTSRKRAHKDKDDEDEVISGKKDDEKATGDTSKTRASKRAKTDKSKEEKTTDSTTTTTETKPKGKDAVKNKPDKGATTSKAKPIPEGYHTATPYLIVNEGVKAIEFYKKAFGAIEIMHLDAGPGKIGHAELKIGNSHIMLADEMPEMGTRSAKSYGGSPMSIALYVEDVDTFFNKAVAAGAKVIKPMQDQFYGDRSGTLEDPFAFHWTVATHIEDVSPEEMHKRGEKEKTKAKSDSS